MKRPVAGLIKDAKENPMAAARTNVHCRFHSSTALSVLVFRTSYSLFLLNYDSLLYIRDTHFLRFIRVSTHFYCIDNLLNAKFMGNK